MLTYTMDDIGSESMYEYLYQCIKKDILQKKLKAGEKLPSKRSFAKNLQVSVITIENAYTQLQVEGYIFSVEKKGYFVSDVTENLEMINRNSKLHGINPGEKQKYFMDFVSNSISRDNFPFSIWSKLLREVLASESSEQILAAAPIGGIPELRRAIADHLYQFRGMSVETEQVIIGAGTEYLYNLLIQLLGRKMI
ncbi:MAG: GntR family transcriptional regulator, partial [Herbinix sp.]|nr:GntR family transcriptional regulator [Herbinix sp.]